MPMLLRGCHKGVTSAIKAPADFEVNGAANMRDLCSGKHCRARESCASRRPWPRPSYEDPLCHEPGDT
ncbi:hypothetical protein NDU88_002286 [Pleurodeles waltl]|uniref:Uncharacterized protein n=1 Tax=Pleurodeles waltl TaxID=8319 RepID=A0AAV7U8U9_PLEWA|nr:hypothetical protein NDU88_002286 [Pleurodeles waltl]